MRIYRIKISNYRQFDYVDIKFGKEHNKKLYVFIGKNGTGKTNILNAINWCLYGDEPHLAKSSHGLPVYNMRVFNEASIQDEIKVFVQIFIVKDDNKFILSRNKIFKVVNNQGKKTAAEIKDKRRVEFYDEENNYKIYEDDNASTTVERIVPTKLREFFFFDGEKLDTYFREATGKTIKDAIMSISQIDIIDSTISHLNNTLTDLQEELGRLDPTTEKITEEITTTKEEIKDKQNRIKRLDEEIKKAKEQKEKIEIDLRNRHGTKEEIIKKDTLNEEIEKLHKKIKRIKSIKVEVIYELTLLYLLENAIKKLLLEIETRRNNNELPPIIDVNLLKEILTKRECICGRKIKEGSAEEKRILSLLENIKNSSYEAKILIDIYPILYNFVSRIEELKKNYLELNEEIKELKEELDIKYEELKKINDIIKESDEEEIKQLILMADDLDTQISETTLEMGKEIKDTENLKEKLKKMNKELEKKQYEIEKYKKIHKQILFTNKALHTLEKTKETIIKDVSKKMQFHTENYFKKLIWKRRTFTSVTFDENYNIKIYHESGHESLGTLSAGERELLALSFILSLQDISGFDFPIFIDTPVARISDENRKNFASVLNKIGSNKQVVLLMTPSEYSKEIEEVLEENSINREISYNEEEGSSEII